MTESVSNLMLEQLHESPFNPRLTFDEAYIAELADSIRQRGVLQPIVVRPMTGREFQFEIVFGHCRTRAAVLAGYVTVPAIVRAMSDEEAALAQIHENSKRADVHPLEEGLGFDRLMRDHGLTVAQLVQKVGKKETAIRARLKLAQLGDAARAACLRGELDAETGVLIARYCRTTKLQERAIDLVTTTVDPYEAARAGDGTPPKRRPISHRQAKAVLREHFCIHIEAAPFDRDDAALKKHVGACNTCPKLAGNDPQLADDMDADICTDPDCYKSKCAAHVDQAVAAAKKAGSRIIDGDEAKQLLPQRWLATPHEHVRVSEIAFVGKAIRDGSEVASTFADALKTMGKAAPKPVLIVNPHRPGDVIEVLPNADALAVLQHGMPGARTADRWDGHFAMQGDDDGDDAPHARRGIHKDPYDDLPAEQQAVVIHTYWLRVLRAIRERVRATRRSTDELRMLVLRELDLADCCFEPDIEDIFGWTAELKEADDENAVRLAKLQAMGPDDLAALLVMLAIEFADEGGKSLPERAERRLALAKRYGVDAIAVAGIQGKAAAGGDDERDTKTGDLFERVPA